MKGDAHEVNGVLLRTTMNIQEENVASNNDDKKLIVERRDKEQQKCFQLYSKTCTMNLNGKNQTHR